MSYRSSGTLVVCFGKLIVAGEKVVLCKITMRVLCKLYIADT